MSSRPVSVAGVGCSLLDIIYPDADFTSDAFAKLASRSPGDGGISPGHLVFASALEEFCGISADDAAAAICAGAEPMVSVGGPAVVALVHAAQVLHDESIPVRFYGHYGSDDAGKTLSGLLSRTPVNTSGYSEANGPTPCTVVLSDRRAADGAGERAFINVIGVAGEFGAESIPPDFYEHRITVFGGTALVPKLHDRLESALQRSHDRGSLTIVTTVYDFRNEERDPVCPWPMGSDREAYRHIDLLVADAEEARRLSGERSLERAIERFLDWGVGAAIVTDGESPVHFSAAHVPFLAPRSGSLPVAREPKRRAAQMLADTHDTTGCGDNFAGGVIAYVARQLAASSSRADTPAILDLRGAVIEGIAAGAAAWFYLGGTWFESEPGEKRAMVENQLRLYLEQLEGECGGSL